MTVHLIDHCAWWWLGGKQLVITCTKKLVVPQLVKEFSVNWVHPTPSHSVLLIPNLKGKVKVYPITCPEGPEGE